MVIITDERKYETADRIKKFASGDRILFTQNDNDLVVKNGTLGTVLKTNEQSITVQPDDKKAKPIIVDLEAYNSLDHGYAVTIHKSQGATVDNTWLFATKSMDQHLMYVAGTRHKVDCKIFHHFNNRMQSVNSQNIKHTTCKFQQMNVTQHKYQISIIY